MTLMNHQIEASKQAFEILKQKGLVYIFGLPRIGKSLVALEVAKKALPLLKKEGRVLIVTRKMAIPSWLKYKELYPFFDIINYESVLKFKPDSYSLVVIDEAHNYAAFPKSTRRFKNTKAFIGSKPVIYLSGTPAIETGNSWYSQLALCQYSPFRQFRNGYEFFKVYGVPSPVWIYGKQVEQYKKCKIGKIMEQVEPYLVKMDYDKAQIKYLNKDDIIYLDDEGIEELTSVVVKTQMLTTRYELIENDSGYTYIKAYNNNTSIPMESYPAAFQCSHRICGGFYRDFKLPQPKLNWLKKFVEEHSGEKIAVMAYFVEEQQALTELFRTCDIYSSTRYCEGIDLSGYDHYILYSFGYSGAKFLQLRDRIVNINNADRETRVIIPLLKNCLDSMIYEKVSQKMDFNSTMLRQAILDWRYRVYE